MTEILETVDINIGDEFWVFDGNRRRYTKSRSRPDFEHHFIKVKITGETSRSWIVAENGNYGFKAPKSYPFKHVGISYGFSKQLLTDQMKKEKIWLHYNKYKLTRFIEHSCSPAQLMDIAYMIGYEADMGEEL